MASAVKGVNLEAPNLDLLSEPLVWFFAEHYRHRQICDTLLKHSKTVILDVKQTQDILNFLENELPLHIIDEEDDFFPLLRRRCQAEDGIDHTLDILSGDHANDLETGKDLISTLKTALLENRGLGTSQKAKDFIKNFFISQRRHIAIENAVILPIARLRLTEKDKRDLGRRLAARRGLADPFKKAS